ncbi:MAG: YebC/PmpR family DNA-binding transcriptional regulator [Myxococcota bacterium]
MSGHNKWSTIKRRKGAQDAKRSKVFTKIIKEITVAARTGGGDPNGNPRLRKAIDDAKAANMPADNLDRAIKKGTGELEGVHYEELTYEGVGPDGVLFLMQIMTDNRNRTASEIRKIFGKHEGELGQSGSAAWAFEEKGVIKLPLASATEEQLFEAAVGAGAEDLEKAGETWVITTPRDDLDTVRTSIEQAGLPVDESELAFLAKTPKTVDGRVADQLVDLYEALEDHDDVQKVFADFELSEQAMAQLEQRA